jgi:two-component system NtrC family sensor kinase
MVQEVRQSREALEEHNRALEERVRQRTEELRQKEHALAQSEKLASLGLLAAGVAHELNNPLTSIMMNANLLKEEAGPDSALARDLQRIDADAGRCRRIIDDLRAFARLRRLDKVPGDVDAVVDQALSAASPELWRRHMRVDRDLDGEIPPIVWDSGRMVQVLTNLLVNAAQAAGPGGGRIVVKARREGDWLRLEVQDDGPGIPEEARTRIFDPFFTTKPDGTGLGLSISHGIVDEHGGRIEVESLTTEEAGAAKRTGTTMRVLLPLSGSSP